MILDGGNRYDLAGALDLRDVDLGDSNVADLAPVAVFLDRGQALFERGLGIDSVQVVERDALRAQTLKLCSISARRTSGRPRPAPPTPPLVATTQVSGMGE